VLNDGGTGRDIIDDCRRVGLAGAEEQFIGHQIALSADDRLSAKKECVIVHLRSSWLYGNICVPACER
jgi:hypothetical protein